MNSGLLGEIDRAPTPEGLDLLVIDTPTAIEFFADQIGGFSPRRIWC